MNAFLLDRTRVSVASNEESVSPVALSSAPSRGAMLRRSERARRFQLAASRLTVTCTNLGSS
jgi:hypothetical protein